jgi:periplasmic mercuric ion binding protein
MKAIKLMAMCLALFTCSFVKAQTSNNKSIEFKVSGNCGMCKKTIETSLKNKSGIKSAVWDKDTKTMKVTYDPANISEEQIHKKIADAGYDTEKKKGSDKAYNSLHKCCQYKKK